MYEDRIDTAAVQQRWEYLCQQLDNPENLEVELNRMGSERWELVNVVTINGALTAIYKSPSRLLSPRKKLAEDATPVNPR